MAFATKSSFRLTAIALAVASIGTQAASIDWATDTSGNWSIPTNWTPIGLPDTNSDVTIVLTGLKTITHNVGNDTINTLSFDASAPNPNATLLVTGGSSLSVRNGGTNGGVIRADNGTMSFNGGVLANNGTLNAINGGTVQFTNGATLRGGTTSTASGGQILVSSSAFLDGATNGTITNTGVINTAGASTTFATGAIANSGAITVGANADWRIAGSSNLTLTGSGTVTLADANSRIYSEAGGGLLTIGAGQTVQGSGHLGINQTRVANSGLITANAAGGTFNLDPSDGAGNFVNTGTLRAENGGTLQLLGGTYTNTGANINALAGSGVNIINGAIVTGGTLATTGSGTITLSASAVLDGQNGGAVTTTGNVGVAGGQTAYALGTLNDNSLTIGANADLRIQSGSDLVLNGGTLTLTDANSRIFGNSGSNLLTNKAGNVIQGAGQIGINTTFVNNAGVITANVNGQTLQIDPVDGSSASAGLVNTGTMRAENGGSLTLLTAVYNNGAGLLTAATGSTVTVTNSATVQGGTVSTSGTGVVNFTGSAVLDGQTQGTLSLSGNVNVVGGQTVYALGTLKDNALTVGANADLRIVAGNNLTLANNGTTTLSDINSRIFGNNADAILTNTAGNTIQGAGQIGVNSAFVANAGLITANVSGQTLQLDPTDGDAVTAGLRNTGTVRAENGGNLNLLFAHYNNAGGTIAALAGSTVTITNGAYVEGGTLSTAGTGAISVTGSSVLDGQTHGILNLAGNVGVVGGQTVYALGTLNDNNLTIGANADLRILGTNNLTLANNGVVTMTDINTRLYGNDSNDILTNTAGNTIQGVGQIGVNSLYVRNAGLITANVAGQTLQFDPTDGDSTNGGLVNTGTIRAENGGNVNMLFGHYNNAGGTIAALTGSTVSITNGAIVEGGTLATTGTGAFNLAGSAVLDGAAHGTLTNTGTINTAGGQTTYFTGTIANSGAITIGGNADWRVQGASNATLTGTGTVTLTDVNTRVFGDNGTNTLTIGAGQTLQGVGQLGINQLQVTNAGTIAANVSGQTLNVFPSTTLANQSSGVLLASDGGTLNLQRAVDGTGTIRSDSAGTVVVGASSTTGKLINNANLSLGTSNVTVSADYSNANFGTGNTFNKRANVTGTGQILASGDVAQAITGATVTNGATGTPTLTIGNVRVGATTTNYQVANTGTTGPAIRGAIQTAVNGGNITDARLSGSGVTSSNYGPVAAGTNSGNLAVTFTASSAGALAPLSGQSVHIANNFDNLPEQTMNIVLASGAAAYNAAVGSASATSFGNTRVGGTLAGNIAVTNTAPAGSFSEDLAASVGSTSGATTTGGITRLVAGQTNATAIGASLNTSTAGAKSGSATLNYTTTGTVNGVANGLAPASVGSQTVALTGNVYQTASGAILTAPLNFGTVQVGQSVSQTLSVRNTATGPGGFVEDLNASFGAASGTGASLILGSGSITGLAAGATSSGLTVGVNTSAVGTVSGTIAVNYFSAGTVNGISNGLGALAVGSDAYGVAGTITTSASVINQASPLVNNPTIALGNVRMGSAAPVGTVSVTNQSTSSPQAALSASISGNAPITASGSFSLLDPGATNASNLHVGFDTSTAGSKNGTATIAFVSDASNVGGCGSTCALTLPSQNVNVTGAVYRVANPTVSGTVTVAARTGDVGPTTAIGVTNASPDIYTEGLNATRGATSAGFTSAGSIANLAAGASSNAITVSLNTATAGTFSGTQALNFVSTGAGTTGAADLALAGQTVALNGKVYTPAAAQVNTPSVNFGIVHVGDAVATTGVSVTNSAAVTALNDVLVASSIGATGPFTASGNLGAGLGAGQTSASALKVGLNTTTAGVYSGTASFSAASHDGDLSDAALANLAVSLVGTVNNYAADAFKLGSGAGTLTQSGSTFVLDYGTLVKGSGTRSTTLVAGNTAAGPADLLDGSFAFLDPADFGEAGFAAFLDLAAGSNTGPLTFSFDTSTVGSFTDTIVLHGLGHNASGFAASIGDISLVVRGTVTADATPPVAGVPEPDTIVLLGLAVPLFFVRRRRRAAA